MIFIIVPQSLLFIMESDYFLNETMFFLKHG